MLPNGSAETDLVSQPSTWVKKRGLVADSATGWSMSVDEQVEEVEQLVRDEEPVLLIGSPMCRAFSTFIELTQACKPSVVELKSDASHTLQVLLQDVRDAAK